MKNNVVCYILRNLTIHHLQLLSTLILVYYMTSSIYYCTSAFGTQVLLTLMYFIPFRCTFGATENNLRVLKLIDVFYKYDVNLLYLIHNATQRHSFYLEATPNCHCTNSILTEMLHTVDNNRI